MVARDVLGYSEANEDVEAHTGPKRLCELALLDSAVMSSMLCTPS